MLGFIHPSASNTKDLKVLPILNKGVQDALLEQLHKQALCTSTMCFF